MPIASDTPVIVGPADFNLPRISKLSDGVLELRDVWLLPGSAGLHDREGAPIEETFLRRGRDLGEYPGGRPQAVDAGALEAGGFGEPLESAVWVAFASTGHFGHELTEFAGNIGSLLACPTGVDGIGGRGALLVVPAEAAHASARLAAILGLPRERVLCTASLERPVRICRAFVPGPSMHNRHGLSLRHFEHVRLVLSRLYGVGAAIESLALPDAGEKLYLTRSLLPEGKRRVRAEEELERELTAAGWRIVAPERLPLAEQLRHLAAARTIAGSLGTALQLVMAFGTSFGHRRLISLGPPAQGCNPNVALQALRQGMPMRHVVCQERDPESATLLRFTVPPGRVATVLEALALLPQW